MRDSGEEVHNSVRKAREYFNRDLLDPRYAEIISDAEHLAEIMSRCDIIAGRRYLDLGTGSGYLAFKLACQTPEISVTGVDVADKAILANRLKAKQQNINNTTFISYSGTTLPFDNGSFHGALSRYAFHHFPSPELSSRELHRVLEPGGFLLISDPLTSEEDDVDFANQFAELRDDGHICWYRENALLNFFQTAGFDIRDRFYSSVTFPRPREERYDALIASTPQRVLDHYDVRMEANHVYMTLPIMNYTFLKPPTGVDCK